MVPRCPNCGEKITKLHQKAYSDLSIWALDEKGKFSHVDRFEVDDALGAFYCPSCSEEIAETKSEAVEFLNKPQLEIKMDKALEEVNTDE